MAFACNSFTRNILSRRCFYWSGKQHFTQVRRLCSEKEKAVRTSAATQQHGTIFDKILAKQLPVDVIHEDELCIAFNDAMPQGPTHFLVIPRKRIPALADSGDQDRELLGHLMLVAKKLAVERAPQGFRLVINNGPHGCQSVYHLHIHVIGGRQMDWPPG